MLPPSLLGAQVVPGTVDEAAAGVPPGGRVHANRRSALVQLPGVGSFRVEDGARVVVDAAPGAPERLLEVWLQGLGAALLLAQRGQFALHANLVEVRGRAVALTGRAGAGKTTASLQLVQRGARLAGDDVLALAIAAGEVLHTTTGRPARIDPATAARLGWDVAGAEPEPGGGGKLLLEQRATAPGPLGTVVVLETVPAEAVETARLRGVDAAAAIRGHAYRARLLARLWPAELLAWSTAVADGVPVHVVRRPAGRWSADEVAAAIEGLAGAEE
jgi:hypothetical protein